MAKLSKRMSAVAALVTSCGVLADVGTDHGYVPIALVEQGRVQRAIAMDINEGPLESAKKNILASHLQDRIETRRSDGVAALAPNEADAILIAGMGGELILHILREGEAVCRQADELILQPQSDVRKVREYLRLHGYKLAEEDMVYEDGKYYPMFRAVRCGAPERVGGAYPAVCDLYGPLLLQNGHPLLRSFLVSRHEQLVQILERLNRQPQSEKIMRRQREVREELTYNESAYTILGETGNAGI